jgi:hypothetical protein
MGRTREMYGMQLVVQSSTSCGGQCLPSQGPWGLPEQFQSTAGFTFCPRNLALAGAKAASCSSLCTPGKPWLPGAWVYVVSVLGDTSEPQWLPFLPTSSLSPFSLSLKALPGHPPPSVPSFACWDSWTWGQRGCGAVGGRRTELGQLSG